MSKFLGGGRRFLSLSSALANSRLKQLPALALTAIAVSGFVACSDSNSGPSEGVATTQEALSGNPDPVVRYWFNEASGTQASDSSGNGYSAALQNGASFVAGARGNAVRIAGGSQRVALPAGVVGSCDDLTIAARVKLATNATNWARIFDIGTGVNSYLFLTPRAGASNILRFGITTSGGPGEQQISFATTFPTNVWKHVAVVLSGSTGTMYLDGAQVAQNTNLTLNPSALGATVSNWLGDSQYAADPTLDGTIDDFLVSCRPYSASEIAWLAAGTDPVALYSFNEPSGTTAADSSGNARTATLANGASFVTGLNGNAVRIAGGTQRVSLPTGIVQSCSDLTIGAHVRLTTNATDWARIFDIGASTTSYMFLSPRAGASNTLRFGITTAGNAAEQRLSFTYSFPTNTWKHVAVVLSGNTGRMYLDGVQVAQNTSMTLDPSALGATVNNFLGDSQFTADPTLDGTIDNLLISCRAFSPTEIGALAGACTTSANCNDGNACTTDTCASGFCTHAASANGTSCPDGNLCNGGETCQSGFCSAGTPPVVDDGNACTTDSCDPVQGVKHTPITGGACGGGGAGGLGGASGSGGASGGGGGGTSGSGGVPGGGGVTCPTGTAPVEMFIELPPGVARSTVALGSYGFTPLEIHDRVRLLAPSGSGFSSASSLSGNPDIPTRLGVESQVQDLWGEPNVELRDRSRVHGNAVSPGTISLFPDAVVDGQRLQQALTPRRRESWFVCHPNQHQGNIDVQPGQVFPTNGTRLATGAWGTLAVKTGARIRLRGAATYFFESVAIEPGAIVDLDTASGGIQLYFRNGGFFRGTQERTDARPNVLFGAENGNFTINGSFRGTVVAPRGLVDLPTAAGGHRGSFFGNLVIAHQSTDVTQEPLDTTGMCPANAACNGLCPCEGGGGGRGQCQSDGDCQPGLVCTENNGACFGGARAQRFCWPQQCLDGIDPGECGAADSPCGSVCGCGNPCSSEDATNVCPPGEECIRDFGRVLRIPSRDACGPTGPGGCPSNDPANCGEGFTLCGTCVCTPDCSHATPMNPGDECGGHCPGVCPTGLVGCCTEDVDCQPGSVCLTDPSGARTCRPEDVCANQALRPPLCGAPNSPCGATCPACTPQCDGRECGPEPNCGVSCGTCGSGEYCDAAGQCTTPAPEPTVTVPDGQGGQQPLPALLSPPAAAVGAIPGRFSVSDQGTASYTIPIDVPPGRMGMTPALSLTYQASRDTGDVGVGWRLDGIQKVTRCPKTFAVDGYAAAVKNDQSDRFCLDGKRLVAVPGTTGVVGEYGGDATEYRTLIDSFAKIVSHRDGLGPQLDLPPGAARADRPQQGPDSFQVRTKDGRIMTFGGTLDSLVMNTDGIRQVWLLRRIEDRSSNTILYSYDNAAAHLAAPQYSNGNLPNMLHPSVIAYTGHGGTAGNREVRFTFEPRTDPSVRFLQGGVHWALQDRLTRVTTYVDQRPVKNYQLVYAAEEFSRLDHVSECEGDGGARCKLPTTFAYEKSPGFEHVTPGPGAIDLGGQLDVNGDGLPDFLETDVSVEGVDAKPALVAAQVSVDIAVGVGTSFLTPAVGMSISQVWSMVSAPIWGLLAEDPEVKIRNFFSVNPGTRGANFTTLQTNGLPCNFANAFLDWEQDGRDDVISACPVGDDYHIRIGHSNEQGGFTEGGTVRSEPHNIRVGSGHNAHVIALRPPLFYDIDGDSLQDMIYCSDECTIRFRRRLSPTDEFSSATTIANPPCTIENQQRRGRVREGDPEPFCSSAAHTVLDVDGDGTPELISSKPGGGWRVLRFSRSGDTRRIEWQNIRFADISLSAIGDALQIADFNRDGLPDVLNVQPTFFVPNGGHNRFEGKNAFIWLNTGNGFDLKTLSHPVPDNRSLQKIAVTDFNDDSRTDWIEHWRTLETSECGSGLNLVRLPNSNFTELDQIDDPADFRAVFRNCPGGQQESAIMNMAADFDGDGSTDIHGGNDIFYGRGAHNLLLTSVEDGLGNVTSVYYDKSPDDLQRPTYESSCAGTNWPEMCLKRMSGLVAEHTEGVRAAVSGANPVVERIYRYTYANARMSATGHGWLGFDRRTIRETSIESSRLPGAPSDNEFTDATTTIVTEPIARYGLDGLSTSSTTFPYVYPLAGLPKTIEIERTKAQTPVESAAFRRKTRIENTWKVRLSASAMPFPVIEGRVSSVFEAEVSAPPEADGTLLTSCTETIVPDAYGNVADDKEICPDENTHIVTEIEPDPSTWIISNPHHVTITSNRSGSALSQIWGFGYFPNGLLQTVTRSPGGLLSERQATVYGRDDFGNVETVSEFVETGEPVRVTTVVYDADNVFPRLITNAKGQTSELIFDRRWGTPKTIIDPNRIAVRHAYDGLGLLSETHDPEGITTYTYARSARELETTPVGRLRPRTKVTIERQGVDGTRTGAASEELDYRGLPVLTTVEGFAGVVVTSEQAFDVRGRLLAATAPHTGDGTVIPLTFYSYDGFDRLKRIIRPDGTPVEMQHASIVTLAQTFRHWLREGARDCHEQDFGCATEVEHSVDEEGKRGVLLRSRLGLVTRSIDGENVDGTARVSDYRYLPFSRLAEIVQNSSPSHPADAPRTLFSPDPFGRLLSTTDPDSGTTTYTYNGFDELKTSLDPKGQLRTFNYDDLGRTTSIVDPSGTTRWIYDQGENALGRLSESISPATAEAQFGQRIAYTYEAKAANNRGLLKRIDYAIDSTPYPVNFTYDDLGRTKTIAYPDLGGGAPIVAKYSYDASGFLNQLEEVGSGTAKPIWLLQGAFQGQLVQQEVFGDNTVSNYSYNPYRRFLETIDTHNGVDFIQDLEYTHYRNGQVFQRFSNTTDVRTHYYDALGRLSATFDTTAPGDPGTSTIYDYDHLGNMTKRGLTTLTYGATKQHLLDTVGANSYQHDANGNVRLRQGPDVPGNVQSFTYTPFDLPRTIVAGQTGATKTTLFEYSADEERLVRRDTGPSLDRTRHFVTDLYQRVVDNISGTTTEERFRLYAGGREVAQIERRNGVDKTLYFHADNLGTPDTITTSEGEVIRQEFDDFGRELDSPSTEVTRSGFTGQEHDRDLGLVDMKGRVYDPLAARFTTPDPVMQAPFWSQGLNRYAYVFNDPVNGTDPSGLQVDAAGSGGGILMAGLMAGGLGSVTYQGFASGMNSPASSAVSVGNVGLKFATGGYVGWSSTPSFDTTGAGGGAAPTTNPGGGGMNASNQNKGVTEPVKGQREFRSSRLAEEPACGSEEAGMCTEPGFSKIYILPVEAMGYAIVKTLELFADIAEHFREHPVTTPGPTPASGAAPPSEPPPAEPISPEAQKGIRSLEKRIAEHERKLNEFKSNPTVRPGMEGQPKEVIEAQQQIRIQHLEKEIQTFRENIEKLRGGR